MNSLTGVPANYSHACKKLIPALQGTNIFLASNFSYNNHTSLLQQLL